jgi:predicted RNA-binding Zn ribbon-like protein
VSDLPSWYPWPETEVKPAPAPLLLVQAFVNTLDFETGDDLLEQDGSWFVEAGLLDRGAQVAGADLKLARRVRESIRRLLESSEADLAPLREVAGARAARLSVGDQGALTLERTGRADVKDALFQLLLIIRAAQEDGTWSRLHVCANDECRWAFYDRSRNRQANWCSMATCGNRLKNRQFRARRRP